MVSDIMQRETYRQIYKQTVIRSDTKRNREKYRPLLDKTPYDTESIVNRAFGLLQYQLVRAADQDSDSVTSVLDPRHLPNTSSQCHITSQSLQPSPPRGTGCRPALNAQ